MKRRVLPHFEKEDLCPEMSAVSARLEVSRELVEEDTCGQIDVKFRQRARLELWVFGLFSPLPPLKAHFTQQLRVHSLYLTAQGPLYQQPKAHYPAAQGPLCPTAQGPLPLPKSPRPILPTAQGPLYPTAQGPPPSPNSARPTPFNQQANTGWPPPPPPQEMPTTSIHVYSELLHI